jgi:uncharacterized protein GlcG (DUF336 family)
VINGGSPSTLTLDGVVASRGGFPLVEAGKLIGAVGCSGGTATQDAMVCQAGAALMKYARANLPQPHRRSPRSS